MVPKTRKHYFWQQRLNRSAVYFKCSSKFPFYRVLLLLLASHLLAAQTFDPNKLNEPQYAKPKNRLFFLLHNERLDSAFLLSAHLLSLAANGQFCAEQSIDAHNTVAKVLNLMGSDQLAQQYVRRALKLYEETGFQNSYYLTRLWNLNAAYQHKNKELRTQTIRLYRKARRWDVENGNTLLAASSLNNVGLVYLNTRDLDSAEFYFLAAKKEYEEANLPFNEFVFSLNSNLAQVAHLKQNYSLAYSYFHSNFKLAYSTLQGIMPIDVEKRKVSSRIGMMQVLLKQKNFAPIDTMLKAAKQIIHHLDFSRATILKEQLLTIEGEILLAEENLEGFFMIQKSKDAFLDSVAEVRTKTVSLFLEELIDLQLQTSRANLEASEKEFKQRTLIYTLVIGMLITVALVVSLMLSLTAKRKQKIEVEKKLAEVALQNTELKKEKLQFQVQSQGRDLGELSNQLVLMRNLSVEVQQKLKRMRSLKSEEQLTEMQNLSGIISRNVAEGKVKSMLQQHLDKVNNEFYINLSSVSTQKLTKAEMEVCAMQRLNMDDKQIAELRGTTQNAVQVARYRIKKKLSLDKDALLDEFLKNL